MNHDFNIGPVDEVKAEALRWACAMGRLSSGFSVNLIWNDERKAARRLWVARDAADRREIEAALRRSGGNKVHAAQRLGIARGTLYNRIRQLGMASILLVSAIWSASAAEFSAPPPAAPLSPDFTSVQQRLALRAITHPRTNCSAVARYAWNAGQTGEVFTNLTTHQSVAVATPLVAAEATIGGLVAGTNVVQVRNSAGASNLVTNQAVPDLGRLLIRTKIELVAPANGILQETTNLTGLRVFYDVRAVTNGEVVAILNSKPAALYRIRR